MFSRWLLRNEVAFEGDSAPLFRGPHVASGAEDLGGRRVSFGDRALSHGLRR